MEQPDQPQPDRSRSGPAGGAARVGHSPHSDGCDRCASGYAGRGGTAPEHTPCYGHAGCNARGADRWSFTVEGPETLDLPVGSTPTLKLQRLPRKDYDQKAELWVAPGLNYLPVRIKLTQANGDYADLLLRSSTAAP